MTTEEKAKAYDEAKARMSAAYNSNRCTIGFMNEIFPELTESEDEKIKKGLIALIKECLIPPTLFRFGLNKEDTIAWLEKQGENSFVNFDEAEKEKYDFVSGQYIQCRASFNEFKEGNSYWLEYIGNDTYIGRSDNILNQKFHITPRQLYRLFTQQHFYKEDNTNEETNAPTGYGKYVDECLNEAAKHFFSEGEDTYSVADLFYAGVRCGKSWLEKQGENISLPKFTFDDILALQCCMETVKKVQEDKDLYEKLNDLHGRVYDAYHLEKQGEKKSIMNVPPREAILAIWDLGNEWKELTGGSISTEHGTQLDYIQKHWEESEYYLKEKQGEQKPAWSEKDEKTWEELIEEVKDQIDSVPAPDCRDKEDEKVLKQLNKWLTWLNSLKDRVQPKQEWSEGDSYMLEQTIKCVNNSGKLEVSVEEIEDWLKYLKDRYTWKPSDEQIDALNDAIDICSKQNNEIGD